MKRSKSYRAAAAKIDRDIAYAPLEAIRMAKDNAKKTYDETVEVVFRLGIDPRKADQMVRGTVNLPHGTGKTARVLVFANGDKAEAAKAAGADYVGSDDLLEKVAGGWLDFDAIVATREAKGAFTSFTDFLDKVPAVVCNKRTIESLIKAGAFDSLGHTRRALLLVHGTADQFTSAAVSAPPHCPSRP